MVYTDYLRVNRYKETTQKILSYYWNMYPDKDYPNKVSLVEYLHKLNISDNSKYFLAVSFTKYLKFINILSREDALDIRRLFPLNQSKWSEKQIDKNVIDKIYKYINYQYKDNEYLRIRNLLIIGFLSTIGMRNRQLTNIETKTVEINDDYIAFDLPLLKKKYEGTTRKSLPMNLLIGDQKLSFLIRPYWSLLMSHRANYFFVTQKFSKMTEENLRRFFQRMSVYIGIRVYPHLLRHYVATEVANKVGIIQASQLLDHENITTTQRYIVKNNSEKQSYNIIKQLYNL